MVELVIAIHLRSVRPRGQPLDPSAIHSKLKDRSLLHFLSTLA